MASHSPTAGPLAGLRVLDLTRVLVGPYATMLLGDLGADVIKVERPGEGDETRHVEPIVAGESHYFVSVNRNKRSIAVDMKSPEGKLILLELAGQSDIMVENFRPGVAARLGLDYESVRHLNPRLVYCSISAFGQTGPYASRSAFDIAIQAMSGVMSISGEPDGPPTRMGLPMADLAGALFATIAINAALYEREKTGHGQFIDLSMLDTMVGLLMYNAGRVFMTGEDPVKIGTAHQGVVPYGAFPCSDGHIVIANLGERVWPKICLALGIPEMATDERYATNSARIRHRAEVEEMISSRTSRMTVAEVAVIFERGDVPHAPILKVSEILAHPQLLARGMVTEVDHPTLGRMPMLGRSIRFPDHEGAPLSPPPLLGQHTDEVLHDLLGYSPERIAALRASGAISDTGGAAPGTSSPAEA